MTTTRSFFLNGQYLGTVPAELPGKMPVRSLAYFCPCCGNVWGRINTSGGKAWDLQYRPCSPCGDISDDWMIDPIMIGCFSGYQSNLPAEDWPASLLRHELLQTITNLLREPS